MLEKKRLDLSSIVIFFNNGEFCGKKYCTVVLEFDNGSGNSFNSIPFLRFYLTKVDVKLSTVELINFIRQGG